MIIGYQRNRGQKTPIILVLITLLLISGVTIGIAVVGGIIGPSPAKSNQSTPGTQVDTVTDQPSSTPTSTITITRIEAPTSTTTSTNTLAPTLPQTPTRTQTPTVSPTPTPRPNEAYDEFVGSYIVEIAERTDFPIQVRGYDIENGTLQFTYNATASSKDSLRRLQERGTLSTAYAQTLLNYDSGYIEGEAPSGMRALEINNTNHPPETFYINNSLAREFGSGQIDNIEYSSEVLNTVRNQTEQEKEWMRNIDRSAGNGTLGPNGTIEYPDSE